MLSEHDQGMFLEPEATRLEASRLIRSRKQHITFNCFNAHVCQGGCKVRCVKGYALSDSKEGLLPLRTVLSGIGSERCDECLDFCSEKT